MVAFAFGLLHGLGFAGALADLSLPVGDIPLAFLFFNVGVEIGQLLFIAAVISIVTCARALKLPRMVGPLRVCRCNLCDRHHGVRLVHRARGRISA